MFSPESVIRKTGNRPRDRQSWQGKVSRLLWGRELESFIAKVKNSAARRSGRIRGKVFH
jgi:hypothetical protein